MKMDRKIADCILPNSPQVRCLDRFSILGDDLEGDDGLVPLWPLLQSVLSGKVNSTSGVIDVLDTISNCIRGSSGWSGNYGMLKQVIDNFGPSFFTLIWPNIMQFALKLTESFPTGKLEHLGSGGRVRLSRGQVGCLVAHQFLCTLPAPSWRDDFYDFSIWYDSSQRHPKAVEMYLTALFTYFERLNAVDASVDLEVVEYSLHASSLKDIPAIGPRNNSPLTQATVVNVPDYSTEQQELLCQGRDGAVVVSANKDIGFGQSATQEELYVGNCPEACPAVLVTPTLRPDQVLVIKGARPMLRILGQRRDISWSILEPPAQGGRMLFMDALEIDEVDENDGLLPDLKPQNVEREILKAYTAFSAWEADDAAEVWSGIWGCGAFNGDPGVKMCILWMAASLARKTLRILCDLSQAEFSALFGKFIGQVGETWTVAELRDRLDAIPKSTKRLGTMDALLRAYES